MYLREFFWTSSTTPSCLMLVPQEAKCLNLILCQKLYNINYYIKQFIFFTTECEQELEWLKEAGFDTIVKKYKGKNLIICTSRIQHFCVVHSYILWFVIKPPTVNYLSAMATIYFTLADTSSLVLTSYDSLLPTVKWYSHIHVPLSPRWSSDCGEVQW